MKNIIDLEGKVALVTGAGGGIGRALAQMLASVGARVIVSDIDADTGTETMETINDARGEAMFVRSDVSDAQSVNALIETVISTYGRLDLAHNNAGLDGKFASITDTDEADFDRSIAVNLKGVWLCLRAELRQMVAQREGAIVNTASAVGLTASAMAAAYGAAKHGVIGLTKTAAVEYAGCGIRVNAVCPGLTRTAMGERVVAAVPEIMRDYRAPIKRLAEPREIAGIVVFLLSNAASYVTGEYVSVDGGYAAV
jgi:NAD(P)-dependent dehydrogenase (short-subunit alcohol dehydrogenase family)